jgi:beta-phosphoglucomutase-like phosphatase (HAD superfamily)
MTCSAIMFGSIGTLAETSELQRQAFNAAFAAFDLDWVWEPDTYYRLLERPGGRERIARYAEAAGDVVDPVAVHALKQEVFARLVDHRGLEPRPGVVELISAARQADVPVAFVTTTTRTQVGLILDGLAPHLSREDFAWIGDASSVAWAKPAPDIWHAALAALDVAPDTALAIEDTPESASSAVAAGLEVVGFPGRAAEGRAFPEGVRRVARLTPALLEAQRVAAE